MFEAGDVGALAAALRRVIAPPERLATLGANALTWTRREFGEDRFADGFLAMAARLGAA